jgi:prevent-host-death family protein
MTSALSGLSQLAQLDAPACVGWLLGSRSATVRLVTTIPQKELRNSVGEVLRRAEAGERFTITVAGRPVAELGPTARRSWVGGAALKTVFDTPVPQTLNEDLGRFPGALADPFA